MTTTSHDIADALTDALLESKDLSRLKRTISDFRKQLDGRTWRVVRQHPCCRNLLDAIEQAIEITDMDAEEEEGLRRLEEMADNHLQEMVDKANRRSTVE